MTDTTAALITIVLTAFLLGLIPTAAQRLDNRRRRRQAAAPARGRWVQIDPEYRFMPGLAGKWGRVDSIDMESLIVMLYIDPDDMPTNAAFDRNLVPFHTEDLVKGVYRA